MKESERLIAARNLIADEKNWMQGRYCDDYKYDFTQSCQFCSVGAVLAVRGETVAQCDINSTSKYLLQAISEIEAGHYGIADFNDSHTHAEVTQMFDKAIQLAQAEGN